MGPFLIALAVVVIAPQVLPGVFAIERDATAQQQQAWRALRSHVALSIPVYQPLWLPAVFRTAQAGSDEVASGNDLCYYEFTYATGPDWRKSAYLALLDVTACGEDIVPRNDSVRSMAVKIMSLPHAQVLIRSSNPELMLMWRVAEYRYAMTAHDVSLKDFLRVAAHLQSPRS